MKYIFFFLLIPFFGISQTITDTLSNANGQLIIRVIDATDTTKVNNELEVIDQEIDFIQEEINILQDRLKEIRKKRAKYAAVRNEKRGSGRLRNNNSPKDSPW